MGMVFIDVIMQKISKSQLKSRLLEYLHKVETEKISLIVTRGGKPFVKISPYGEDTEEILKSLRGSVISYKDPDKPVWGKKYS